jgi:hypothetical protein
MTSSFDCLGCGMPLPGGRLVWCRACRSDDDLRARTERYKAVLREDDTVELLAREAMALPTSRRKKLVRPNRMLAWKR